MMPDMVTRERAVALVEALLIRQQQDGQRLADVPDVAVCDVTEHPLGWLVHWQSVAYVRSGDFSRMLVGHGPYLVDRKDGSIHHIPVTTFVTDQWEALYLQQVRGIKPPDPLLIEVRALVQRAGSMAALRHVRQQAPRMALQDAKAYVDAVRDGADPSEHLTALTREDPNPPLLAIETLAAPCAENPET